LKLEYGQGVGTLSTKLIQIILEKRPRKLHTKEKLLDIHI